jgi:hypothetical protein
MKFNLLIEQILQQINEDLSRHSAYNLYRDILSSTDTLQNVNIKPGVDIKKFLINSRGEEKRNILKNIRDKFKTELLKNNYRNINTKTEEEQENILDGFFQFLQNNSTNNVDDRILHMLKSLHHVAFIPNIVSDVFKKPEKLKSFLRPKGF